MKETLCRGGPPLFSDCTKISLKSLVSNQAVSLFAPSSKILFHIESLGLNWQSINKGKMEGKISNVFFMSIKFYDGAKISKSITFFQNNASPSLVPEGGTVKWLSQPIH